MKTIDQLAEEAWADYTYPEGNLYSNVFKDAFKLGAKAMQDRLKEVLDACVEIGYINEYPKHRILELMKGKDHAD